MLAALLLNLGGTPPPPQPPRFGGGPFWSRYGYDRAYDAIRRNQRSTSSDALPVLDDEEPPLVVGRPDIQNRTEPPQLNYRLLDARVSNAVAADMHQFRDIREQDRDDEEAEAIMIMFFLGD